MVKILSVVGVKSEALLSPQTLILRRSPLHIQIEAVLPNIHGRHDPKNHHLKRHKLRLLLVLKSNLALNNRLLFVESNNSLLLVNIRFLIFKNCLLKIHRRHSSYQTIKTLIIMKRKMRRTIGKKMGRKSTKKKKKTNVDYQELLDRLLVLPGRQHLPILSQEPIPGVKTLW